MVVISTKRVIEYYCKKGNFAMLIFMFSYKTDKLALI